MKDVKQQTPSVVIQCGIFMCATGVALATFAATFGVYVNFSTSGDFSIIIALAVAGMTAFAAWAVTLNWGLAFAERKVEQSSALSD